MSIVDYVEIRVLAGGGGDGCISFRREKFVPRGGPDGGDGGKGGDVKIRADPSLNTLYLVGRKKLYRAGAGAHGRGSGMHGASGKGVDIRVPVGTQVWKKEDSERTFLGDLTEPGRVIVVAKGGLGGWGNARFATPTNRAPAIAQRGQSGEEVELVLELKLLADVGIVGLPNVGKSSLLAAISAARPKIAAYPFTTTEPVLGVVEHGYMRFVVVDIPGLIEGAARGAGLGHDFLRHIERSRILLHLVDGSRADPGLDMETVESELDQYGGLIGKERVVVVNKIDIPTVRERILEIRQRLGEKGVDHPLFVSAASGEGTAELIQRLAETLARAGKEKTQAKPLPIVKPEGLARSFVVSREDEAFRVEGGQVVTFAAMMPLDSEEGRAAFWQRLARQGVVAALRRAGARPGDHVRFGSIEVEWQG